MVTKCRAVSNAAYFAAAARFSAAPLPAPESASAWASSSAASAAAANRSIDDRRSCVLFVRLPFNRVVRRPNGAIGGAKVLRISLLHMFEESGFNSVLFQERRGIGLKSDPSFRQRPVCLSLGHPCQKIGSAQCRCCPLTLDSFRGQHRHLHWAVGIFRHICSNLFLSLSSEHSVEMRKLDCAAGFANWEEAE